MSTLEQKNLFEERSWQNKETNICIDARALLGAGGVPEYTKQLIKYLDTEGKKIYLFCNSLKKLKEFESKFLKVFFRIPNKFFNLSLLFFKKPHINKLIEKKIDKKIDLFFLPNINFWQSKNDKKIIVAHDLSFAIYPKFFQLQDRFWHWIIKPQKLYRSADMIIAVSENTKRDLMDIFKISPEKIKVIYPGVSIDAKELLNKKENYILYLANLEPRKNILGLIDAYEHCDTDCDLYIAGAGKYKSVIKRRVLKSFKRKKIKLTGYIKESEKAKLIYEAQLFVYPSFYEGFGFPPLEAQLLGVPVVASLTSSMSEVLGDSALLVNPYNTKEIARAMGDVLNNKNLQEKLIEKGWENVRRFNWERCAKEVSDAINTIL